MCESLTLLGRDPVPVRAELSRPSKIARVVVIAPATGIPQRFYRSFAQWLAGEHESLVLTFDPQLMGASMPPGTDPTKPEQVRQALIDHPKISFLGDHVRAIDAAIKHADSLRPSGAPLVLIGHSQGGLLSPLAPSIHLVDRAIHVGVYWQILEFRNPNWPAREVWDKLLAGSRHLGYYPSSRVGLGDVTSEMGAEWHRWIDQNPEYIFEEDKGAFEAYTVRTLSIFFRDDAFTTLRQIDAPLIRYGAHSTRLAIEPGAVGAKAVGHLGAFGKAQKTLWTKVFWPFIKRGEIAQGQGIDRWDSSQAKL